MMAIFFTSFARDLDEVHAEKLILRRNSLTSFQQVLKFVANVTTLYEIDVSHNDIAHVCGDGCVASKCFSGEDQCFDSMARLQKLPNLKRIIFSGNRILGICSEGEGLLWYALRAQCGSFSEKANSRENYASGPSYNGNIWRLSLRGEWSMQLMSSFQMEMCKKDHIHEFSKMHRLTSLRMPQTRIRSMKFVSYLQSLKVLDLSMNRIQTYETLPQGLHYVDLSKNKLNGSVLGFQHLQELHHLSLHDNFLSGSFGDIHFSKVEHLDLKNNKRLSGRIPDWIGKAQLRRLSLKGNSFNGSMPRLASAQLSYLDTSTNNLRGEVFPVILSKRLSYLDISENAFDGEIPAAVGQLTSLQHMDLSSNRYENHSSTFVEPANIH